MMPAHADHVERMAYVRGCAGCDAITTGFTTAEMIDALDNAGQMYGWCDTDNVVRRPDGTCPVCGKQPVPMGVLNTDVPAAKVGWGVPIDDYEPITPARVAALFGVPIEVIVGRPIPVPRWSVPLAYVAIAAMWIEAWWERMTYAVRDALDEMPTYLVPVTTPAPRRIPRDVIPPIGGRSDPIRTAAIIAFGVFCAGMIWAVATGRV